MAIIFDFLRKRWKVYGTAIVLFLIIATGFSIKGLFSANKNITHVKMILVHPSLEDVEVSVPVEYLGPKFLDLSRQNRLGGVQKRFLIEFFYPSMRPSTTETAYLQAHEKLIYASIAVGVAGGTRRFGERETSNGQRSWYFPTKNTLCGMSEFEQRIKDGNLKTHHTLYYHKDGNIHMDIVFICDDNVKLSTPCFFSMESLVSQNIKTSFYIDVNSFPKKDMCEWRDFAQKMRKLTDIFLAIGE